MPLVRESPPCFFRNHASAAACSGDVTTVIENYYRHHRSKELSESGVDAILVCDAHAEWHSNRCARCTIRLRNY